MLRTEPSFSIYNSEDGFGEESENGCSPLERSVTIGDSIGSREFSFGKKGMGLIEEDDNEKEQDGDEEEALNGFKNLGIEEIARPVSPPMYLATGFGMDGNGVGGGGGFGVDFTPSCFDEGGDVEDYYKRMVSEDPSNPLFLRNYAKLLQVSFVLLYLCYKLGFSCLSVSFVNAYCHSDFLKHLQLVKCNCV